MLVKETPQTDAALYILLSLESSTPSLDGAEMCLKRSRVCPKQQFLGSKPLGGLKARQWQNEVWKVSQCFQEFCVPPNPFPLYSAISDEFRIFHCVMLIH